MTDDLVRRAQVRFWTSSLGVPGFQPAPTWQFEILEGGLRGLGSNLPIRPGWRSTEFSAACFRIGRTEAAPPSSRSG